MLDGPYVAYFDEKKEIHWRRASMGGGTKVVSSAASASASVLLGVQEMAEPGQIEPAITRDLLVVIRFATDGDARLPALAQAKVGRRITVVRAAGAGVPRIVLSQPTTDQVNGLTNFASFTPYTMRSLQDAVTYLRVPDGYVREQGTPTRALVQAAFGSLDIPPGVEGTLYALSRVAPGSADANLPDAAECRPGYRVFFVNVGSSWLNIIPSGVQRINRSTLPYRIPTGATALFEVMSADEWCALADSDTPLPIESGAASVLLSAWRGFDIQIVRASNAAGVVHLPSTVLLPVGAKALVENLGAGTVTVDAFEGQTINGQLTRAVPAGRATLLVMNGFSWTATGGES